MMVLCSSRVAHTIKYPYGVIQTCRGLGYHGVVFFADLKLFYSMHFPLFNSSLGWVVNLVFQDCMTVTSVQNEVPMLSNCAYITCNKRRFRSLDKGYVALSRAVMDVHFKCIRLGPIGHNVPGATYFPIVHMQYTFDIVTPHNKRRTYIIPTNSYISHSIEKQLPNPPHIF